MSLHKCPSCHCKKIDLSKARARLAQAQREKVAAALYLFGGIPIKALQKEMRLTEGAADRVKNRARYFVQTHLISRGTHEENDHVYLKSLAPAKAWLRGSRPEPKPEVYRAAHW